MARWDSDRFLEGLSILLLTVFILFTFLAGTEKAVDIVLVAPIWKLAAWQGHPLGARLHVLADFLLPIPIALALFAWGRWDKWRARQEKAGSSAGAPAAPVAAPEKAAPSPPPLAPIGEKARADLMADLERTRPRPPEQVTTPSSTTTPVDRADDPPRMQTLMGCIRPWLGEESVRPGTPAGRFDSDAMARTAGAGAEGMHRPSGGAPGPAKAPPRPRITLSANEWATTPDPVLLLQHAIPRIPLRHTCLVLAQLGGTVWPAWSRRFPDDWRPGWCLGLLRGWSLGEASRSELDAAIEAARKAALRTRPVAATDTSSLPAHAAVRVIECATRYARFHETDPIGAFGALDLLAWLGVARYATDPGPWRESSALADPVERPLLGAHATFEAIAAERSRRMLGPRASARYADLIRTWVSYPWRQAAQWRRTGNWVRAGDASLALDGWRIASARPLRTSRDRRDSSASPS